MRYKFGGAFTIQYYYDDGVNFAPSNDNPTIYLFDKAPEWSTARSGTGALQTITSWTSHGEQNNAKEFTLSAISDPEPTGAIIERKYYLAINYTLAVSGDVITDIQEILLVRPKGFIPQKEVTTDEIKEFFPEIVSYASDDNLLAYLDIAYLEVEADFKKKGIVYKQIRNQADFYLPLVYKVISLVSQAEFREVGDRHYKRYEDFNLKYLDYLTDLKVEVDIDGDGDTDVTTDIKKSLFINFK